MPRAIQDASLQVTTTLGSNANTTRGNSIDLGAVTPYPITEVLSVTISTTAATGANNKNVNIRLQHSPDAANVNFVNIPELDILTIPEVNAAYAATTRTHSLPASTKQFIRVICVTESSGGNASDGTAVLKVLF
ncbi:MAG TPA: hypothetical protein VNT99_08270 [Methylomirabilota bacterium]|nr:hypothetical protein [Methylomirabilota bacterium]